MKKIQQKESLSIFQDSLAGMLKEATAA